MMLEIDKLSAHINNHVHGLSHGAYHLLRHAARLRRRRVGPCGSHLASVQEIVDRFRLIVSRKQLAQLRQLVVFLFLYSFKIPRIRCQS